jgi:hypothetical protein
MWTCQNKLYNLGGYPQKNPGVPPEKPVSTPRKTRVNNKMSHFFKVIPTMFIFEEQPIFLLISGGEAFEKKQIGLND